MYIECENEDRWKAKRLEYLTASDASNYMQVNPYDPNGLLHLWEEKTGTRQRPDISSRPAVAFGRSAEELLRDLFLLRHSEYQLRYDRFGLWVSDTHPFMAATLDGLLTDSRGAKHILEIKTATARDGQALKNWTEGDGVPLHYHCQVCHQLHCIPDAAGAYVYAYVQTSWNPQQSYLLERYIARDRDTEEDIALIVKSATDMWELVKNRKRPSVSLSI